MHPRTFAAVSELPDVSAVGPLPTEFRVFRAGRTDTIDGRFCLYDELSSKAVRDRERERAGVLYMVDLEHDSLSWMGSGRPDSRDARGWYRLDHTRNGDLWAVDADWTPDGEERIRTKRQRYISPAFYDDEDGRVTNLINVALCAQPATRGAMALMSRRSSGKSMREQFRAAHAALQSGDSAGASAILQHMLASPHCYALDPSQVQPALDAIKAGDGASALEILESLLVAAAGGTDAAPPDDSAQDQPADGPPATETPADEAMAQTALWRELQALTGTSSAGEALAAVRSWSSDLTELRRQRAALDESSRRELVGELVRLGRELPATAWTGEGSDRRPAPHLAAEPLDSLRARVRAYRAVGPATPTQPPAGPPIEDSVRRRMASMTPEHAQRFQATIQALRGSR